MEPMEHALIPALLGSSYRPGSEDPSSPPMGFRLLADERCVAWAGGSPVHPSSIETLVYCGTRLSVLQRFVVPRNEVRWSRARAGRIEHVTVPAHEEHILIFRTPSGQFIEYKHAVGAEATITEA